MGVCKFCKVKYTIRLKGSVISDFSSANVASGAESPRHILCERKPPIPTVEQCHVVTGASPGRRVDEDYRRWPSVLHPRRWTGRAPPEVEPSSWQDPHIGIDVQEGHESSKRIHPSEASLGEEERATQDGGLDPRSWWPPNEDGVHARKIGLTFVLFIYMIVPAEPGITTVVVWFSRNVCRDVLCHLLSDFKG